MKVRDIRRFFEELDRPIDTPVQILLTGGVAAILWGVRRATYDVEDLRVVLKAVKTNPRSLALLWGIALGTSPSSNTQALFRRQVESFFDTHGREIWGPHTEPASLKKRFLMSAHKSRAVRSP
jgi:hypothetical protein